MSKVRMSKENKVQLKTILTIANMEFGQNKQVRPSLSRMGLFMLLIYTIGFSFIAIYFFGQEIHHPIKLLATLTMSIFCIGVFIGLFDMLGTTNAPHREWWLTLPHSRLTLTLAKALHTIRLTWIMSIPVALAGAVYYYTATEIWSSMPTITLAEWVIYVPAFALIVFILAPLSAALGFVVITLFQGKLRWVYFVPYIVFVFGLFPLTFVIQLLDVSYLSLPYLLLYALVGMAVGWPIAYALLRYIAKHGMTILANMHAIGRFPQHRTTNNKKLTIMAKQSPNRTPFKALYDLERSRYMYIGSLPLVKITFTIILVIIGLIAFFATNSIAAVLSYTIFQSTLPLFAPLLWVLLMNMSEAQRRRVEWWLSYPHARIQLLIARLAAVWVTAMRYIGAMAVVFWSGAGLALYQQSIPLEQWRLGVAWFIFGVGLYAVMLLVSISVLQIVHYAVKSVWVAILIAPLYFAVFYQSAMVWKYWFPAEGNAVYSFPNWTPLILLIAIGLPLAAFSLHVGARYLNEYMMQVSPSYQRQQS